MGGELTIGGVSLVLLSLMVWVIKRLFREREQLFKERANDFKHIKQKLDELPCAAREEQLRQHEKILNGFLKGKT